MTTDFLQLVESVLIEEKKTKKKVKKKTTKKKTTKKPAVKKTPIRSNGALGPYGYWTPRLPDMSAGGNGDGT